MTDRPPHTASCELLWHYRCGACERWWSIADGPGPGDWPLFCPLCGHEAEVDDE